MSSPRFLILILYAHEGRIPWPLLEKIGRRRADTTLGCGVYTNVIPWEIATPLDQNSESPPALPSSYPPAGWMILDFRRTVHPKRAAQEISGDPGSSLDWPAEGSSWAAPTRSPVQAESGCTNIREQACLRGGFIFATPVIVVRGNVCVNSGPGGGARG